MIVPALLVAALFAAVPAPWAAAQQPAPSADELGLELEVGFEGQAVDGEWLPVLVRLAPARPVDALLVVESVSRGGLAREEREVEAPTGSVKEYRFLVPAGSVTVGIEEAGRETLEVRSDHNPAPGRFAIGVLGGAPVDPPAVTSDVTDLTGSWAGVEPAWLELSALALQPLGALVADLATLDALPATAQRNLSAAVHAGTDLVVITDRPGPLPTELSGGLPSPARAVAAGDQGPVLDADEDVWTLDLADLPGPRLRVPGAERVVAAAAPAGKGRVMAVTVAPSRQGGLSEALWSQLVGPTPRIQPPSIEFGPEQIGFRLASALTDAEGEAEVPALPWLAGFIVAYILVAGPINGLVVSRFGRRELSWITIPATTAIFTVGALFTVSGARPPVGLSASATIWIDGVGSEIVAAAARAPTPGEHTIRLPGSGWAAQTVSGAGRSATLVRDGEGLRASLDLTALQLGGVVASRAVDGPAPLAVEAVATADGVRATVTNTTNADVHDVVVRAATAIGEVRSLGPGASETVTIGGDSLSSLAGPLGVRADQSSTPADLFSDSLLQGNPGMVWALGSLAAGGTSVVVDGAAPENKGRLVGAGAAIRLPSDGTISPYAVHRAVFPGRQVSRVDDRRFEGRGSVLMRFRLPAGGVLDPLYADLSAATNQGGEIDLSVWAPRERRWLPVGDAFPDRPGEPPQLVGPLGEVWVRATGDLFGFNVTGQSLSGVDPEATR